MLVDNEFLHSHCDPGALLHQTLTDGKIKIINATLPLSEYRTQNCEFKTILKCERGSSLYVVIRYVLLRVDQLCGSGHHAVAMDQGYVACDAQKLVWHLP